MASHLRLTPLAGMGKPSGGIWHIQLGRRGFLLDFGIDLALRGDLLGTRLRLRDTRGLLDPIELGLLPQLEGVYRKDLLELVEEFEEGLDLDVRAFLISHQHADHYGLLYSADPNIPVFSSAITAALAHAYSLSGTGLAAETTMVVPRVRHERERELLVKTRGVEAIPRVWNTVDGEPGQRLKEFCDLEGFGSVLKQSTMEVAGLQFQAHEIDHSLYGAISFEFLAPEGRVVFLTDCRQHGKLAYKTEKLICHMESHRPDLLLLEGTRLGRKDDEQTTERQAKQRIIELVESSRKSSLVIGILNPNNLERLSAFNAAAKSGGRKLVVLPRVKLMIEAVRAARPSFDFGLNDVAVLDPALLSRPSWHKNLRDRNQNCLVSIEQIKRDPGKFVLATTPQRRAEWIDLKPEKALMIFSASGAYSEEARGEHAALRLWADMYDMKVAGLTSLGVDPMLCPSGHMHADDLKELLHRVRPEVLVPVHTDHPELFRGLVPKGTRIVIPENGRSIKL
jgi:ribonuclease J